MMVVLVVGFSYRGFVLESKLELRFIIVFVRYVNKQTKTCEVFGALKARVNAWAIV
jgi:hypothetical protein